MQLFEVYKHHTRFPGDQEEPVCGLAKRHAIANSSHGQHKATLNNAERVSRFVIIISERALSFESRATLRMWAVYSWAWNISPAQRPAGPRLREPVT